MHTAIRSDRRDAMGEEIKILTPIGMLGYSFSEKLFWSAVESGIDAIIVDSGSIDSGPAKLAFGQTTASRQEYKRDLTLLVSACHYHSVPVLIGEYLQVSARRVDGGLEETPCRLCRRGWHNRARSPPGRDCLRDHFRQ